MVDSSSPRYGEEALRPMVRESEGRDATPSGAIIDSQSVKTTEKGGLAAMAEGRLSKGEPGGGLALLGFNATVDVTEAERTFTLQGSWWDR